jgi:hypothetical protein
VNFGSNAGKALSHQTLSIKATMTLLNIIIGLCLSLHVCAFNIITPHAGEVINVDELYNLTWTTDKVAPQFQVNSIQVNFPDIALLSATEGYYYLQGFGTSINISATDGYYPLNLSTYWSPLYNEFPHGSWSISLELLDFQEERPIVTMMNDTVEVKLTSSKPSQGQRPQLPPIKTFAFSVQDEIVGETSASSGIGGIILSILIPVLVIVLAIWLVRCRWKRHSYHSLSNVDNIRHSETSSSNWPPADPNKGNDKGSQIPDSGESRRLPWSFLLAAILAIIPLVALFLALILLLLLYKVKPSTHSRADFAFNESGSDPAAFYIDYDATRYTTVASWTSSIALLLPGFLTSLIWYRETQQLESDASQAKYDKLLTPYQLSLLLSLKSGTLGSLWEYFSYIFSRRREKQAKFLSDAGFVVLMSTLLG